MTEKPLRANGGDPSTIEYWRHELLYWQELKRDGTINEDLQTLDRAKRAINICTKHLGGMIRGEKANY